MLYRRVPQTVPDCHEHLVIELKAPTCIINPSGNPADQELCFTRSMKIRDSTRRRPAGRFFWSATDWVLLAEHECSIDGRERGHIYASNGGKFNIHVREWSSILANAKWRYEFFREKLEYQASTADGMEYLRRGKHSEYLPDLGSDDDNKVKTPTRNGGRSRGRNPAPN